MNAPSDGAMPPRKEGKDAARCARPDNLQDEFIRESLSSEHMRAAYDYWWENRGSHELPPADVIDPLRIPRTCLPFIVILEVETQPLRLRCRLAGTQVAESLGVDLTGSYIDELPSIEKQLARMEWCVGERRPYLVEDAVTFAPHDYRRYRTMALPFGDDGEGVERIVFVFDFPVPKKGDGE